MIGDRIVESPFQGQIGPPPNDEWRVSDAPTSLDEVAVEGVHAPNALNNGPRNDRCARRRW